MSEINEINPEKWYRPKVIAEAGWIQKPSINFVSSSYAYILKLIRDGSLSSKNYGQGKTPYFAVQGKEILRFIKEN